MGSGVSSEHHMFEIIRRDLTREFYEKDSAKPRFIDGIEIPEDFSDEVRLKKDIAWAKRELVRIRLLQQKTNKNI
jgi:hypothetical protein